MKTLSLCRRMMRVVALAGTLAAAHAAEPPPVADFFAAPAMSQPELSPAGKYLAVHIAGRNGRRQLAVMSLDPPREAKVVAAFSDADVATVHWVNEERIVFTIADLHSTFSDGFAPGLFAVDRTGENLRALVERRWELVTEPARIGAHELRPNHFLSRVLRDGSSDVLIERLDFDGSYRNVLGTTPLRLDTRTGRTRSLEPGLKEAARDWLFDADGKPRLAVALKDGRRTVYWRAQADADWTEIANGDQFNFEPGKFSPFALGPDDVLYATALRRDPERTRALYRFDRAAGRLEGEPVVGLKGFDFDGELMFDAKSHQLTGVHYVADAAGTVWFDPAMKALQARIDERAPGLINLIDTPECGCTRWVLVTSFSDRQPPIFLLYDREADSLEPIGAMLPKIDPRRMAQRDFERFRARDGLTIPVHVTRPVGSGPWPTVVLVHGGPQVRGGSWGWDTEAQFLASRGYLVVAPEFRGSAGYGARLFVAGFRQWGLKMQDDIADAARWAIGKGLADPARVCIAGGSYGGYATLMGLIKDPDLYRCGIAWAAVTDIGLMYSLTWSDLPDAWKRYGMPRVIGHPVRDAAQFEATSPLKQAARLKRPLLLAHGTSDRRVPIDHGNALRNALREHNDQVDWVVYPGEGHGWFKPENRYDFWTRVEAFLARQLPARP